MEELQKIKNSLLDHCLEELDQKIILLQRSLTSIIDSKNNETKSSAGDKYETGRAMMQIEEDKMKNQLLQTKGMQLILKNIDLESRHEKAVQGSLVKTDKGIYFLSVGLGKVSFDERIGYCISTQSPIGKLIVGKMVGDEISFQGRSIVIEGIA